MCQTITKHPILEIEHGPKVRFTFNGKPLQGYAGEPIAAALLENGIHIFRQTEKKRQPRSLFCGIGQCNDCVVVVNSRPNVRSCVTKLEEGMAIESQKGFGKVGSPCV